MQRRGWLRPKRGLYDSRGRSPSRWRRSRRDDASGSRSSALARLLVAGAAGFLGSHFVERLLADGHQAVGVDDFITAHQENLPAVANEPRFETSGADVTEPLQ